jgi:hypothetical protein
MAKDNRIKITGAVSEGGLLKDAKGNTYKLRWGEMVNVMIGGVVLSGVKVKDDLAGHWTAEIPLDAAVVSVDTEPQRVTGSGWELC